MTPRFHPTALVEEGVDVGSNTVVWDNVHIRAGARIGEDCIVGEKTYIAYGVTIGDRVKINAFVYVCAATTIEDGVMVSAGTIFTNDLYPRATEPDLLTPRSSEPDERTLGTVVRRGATLGARCVIGPGLVIGQWSMVGMGAVVTRSVPDFQLVTGSPARPVACVCRCGEPFVRFAGHRPPDRLAVPCRACGLRFDVRDGMVAEHRATESANLTGARR